MREQERVERQREGENHYDIFGKITLMRHGATEYTGEYPDLTALGIKQANELGDLLEKKIDKASEDVLVMSSPTERAQGTADIMKHKLGKEDKRVTRALRPVEIRDREEAQKIIDRIIGPERDSMKTDEAYARQDLFENTPQVWEPRSRVEKRFFRGIEYVIRAFNKYQEKGEKDKIPYLIAVTHFELLNHFAEKVFKLPEKKEELLKTGESIEIILLEAEENNKDLIPMLVTFRGVTRKAVFNRNDRTIETENGNNE